ncbi:MAG: hypothetical protein WKF50_14000 [Nocardioides sp.]
MIRLIGLELTRLRWRRAVLLLLIACLVVPVVIFAATAWTTRPVSEADLRQAQEQVERDRADPSFQREIERCEKRPNRYGVADAAECADMMGPRVEWYISRPQLSLQEVLHGQGLAVVIFLTGLLMLAATTFVGADWNSGSMSNQLLFEPRRLRIWLTKAGAVMAVAVVTLGVVLTAFWGGMYLLARSRDIEPLARVVTDIQWTSLRAVLLVAAATLGAYAVTMLFRSTVFTLGALFAVVIGSTVVLAALGISEQWMPHINVAAFLNDGARYYRDVADICFQGRRPPEGADCRQYGVVSFGDGALYLGVALAAAVGLSAWSFRRRDVP